MLFMTPTQYLLCGIPFSGKTTLGQALHDKLGFVHINLDAIKKEKGYGDTCDDDVPDTVWTEIFREADSRMLAGLKEGKSVAHETAWVTRAWRDRARDIATEAGFPTKIIFLDIPKEVALSRQSANRTKQTRYDTPDTEFQDYVTEFERPTPDEDIIIYDGIQDLSAWISHNFN